MGCRHEDMKFDDRGVFPYHVSTINIHPETGGGGFPIPSNRRRSPEYLLCLGLLFAALTRDTTDVALLFFSFFVYCYLNDGDRWPKVVGVSILFCNENAVACPGQGGSVVRLLKVRPSQTFRGAPT